MHGFFIADCCIIISYPEITGKRDNSSRAIQNARGFGKKQNKTRVGKGEQVLGQDIGEVRLTILQHHPPDKIHP